MFKFWRRVRRKMKKVELKIVRSTSYPDRVSIRSVTGEEVREVISKAGFTSGDRVVLIDFETWEKVNQKIREDETTVIN